MTWKSKADRKNQNQGLCLGIPRHGFSFSASLPEALSLFCTEILYKPPFSGIIRKLKTVAENKGGS
jgi:hypothetical protein